MKRVVFVMFAALVFAPDAAAKCCALVTPVAPRDLAAGEEWTATIDVRRTDTSWPVDQPLTLIAWIDTSRKLVSERARETARPGIYEATVVFPAPGVWSYTVTFGGFEASVSSPLRKVAVEPRQEARRLRKIVPAAVATGTLLLLGAALRSRRRSA